MSEQDQFDFESGMSRLEEIVKSLDGGQLSLSESLLLFEEGVKLARECSGQLSKAQEKLDILVVKSDGTLRGEPFELN
jgi:exodeoxyribonuclease VII small subunit